MEGTGDMKNLIIFLISICMILGLNGCNSTKVDQSPVSSSNETIQNESSSSTMQTDATSTATAQNDFNLADYSSLVDKVMLGIPVQLSIGSFRADLLKVINNDSNAFNKAQDDANKIRIFYQPILQENVPPGLGLKEHNDQLVYEIKDLESNLDSLIESSADHDTITLTKALENDDLSRLHNEIRKTASDLHNAILIYEKTNNKSAANTGEQDNNQQDTSSPPQQSSKVFRSDEMIIMGLQVGDNKDKILSKFGQPVKKSQLTPIPLEEWEYDLSDQNQLEIDIDKQGIIHNIWSSGKNAPSFAGLKIGDSADKMTQLLGPGGGSEGAIYYDGPNNSKVAIGLDDSGKKITSFGIEMNPNGL